MRISIAMATYNGGKYLQEQLNSLVSQTRMPDELVVCDDGSTDNTLEILDGFSAQCPFEVRVIKNKENLGYTRNFEKAISLCTGDIIFICDQDDFWFQDKIAEIESIFNEDVGIMVVLNDQIITDENLLSTNLTVMSNVKLLGFSESWLCAGSCSAIRSSFLPMLMPFTDEIIAYDGWIHTVAIALNVRKIVPSALQKYRRHPSTTTDSIAASHTRPNFITPLLQYGVKDVSLGWAKEIELSSYLQNHLASQFSTAKSLGIEYELANAITNEKNKSEALLERIRFLKKNRFFRIYNLLGFYLRGNYKYFRGWKSLAKDLIRPQIYHVEP